MFKDRLGRLRHPEGGNRSPEVINVPGHPGWMIERQSPATRQGWQTEMEHGDPGHRLFYGDLLYLEPEMRQSAQPLVLGRRLPDGGGADLDISHP